MSIKNHVAEYLLKPTDFEDFEETFLRLKNTLDKERLQTAHVSESVQRHFQIWLTSLLEGTALPEESERFLPMLAAQEIDTDNLVVAAFTLDGHGGDEKTDLLESVAASVHKTPAYISRVFKNELGCNFSDYLTEKRMHRAAELLKEPDGKVYLIAQQCGYADTSNFIRVFKKYYGISPVEYRAAQGGAE